MLLLSSTCRVVWRPLLSKSDIFGANFSIFPALSLNAGTAVLLMNTTTIRDDPLLMFSSLWPSGFVWKPGTHTHTIRNFVLACVLVCKQNNALFRPGYSYWLTNQRAANTPTRQMGAAPCAISEPLIRDFDLFFFECVRLLFHVADVCHSIPDENWIDSASAFRRVSGVSVEASAPFCCSKRSTFKISCSSPVIGILLKFTSNIQRYLF